MGDFGYRFCSKSHHHSSMTIEVRGIQETVEILHFFPFSAETKRTSIIIRFRGEIMLFCKVKDGMTVLSVGCRFLCVFTA